MKKRAIELMSEVSKIQEEALEVLRITKYDFNTAEVIKEVQVPVEVVKEVQVPVETIKKVEVPVEVVKEVKVSLDEDKATIKSLTNRIKLLEAELKDKKANITMLEQQIESLKANNASSIKEEDNKVKKTYDIVNEEIDEDLSIITRYDNAVIGKYKGEIFEAALDIKATALYAPYNEDSEKLIAELEEQLIKHKFINDDRKNKDIYSVLNETGYCYKIDKDKYMGYVFNKAGDVMNFVWDTKTNDVPAFCMLKNRINNKTNYKAASKKQAAFVENVKSLVELRQQKVDKDIASLNIKTNNNVKANMNTSSSNETGMEGLTGANSQTLFGNLM